MKRITIIAAAGSLAAIAAPANAAEIAPAGHVAIAPTGAAAIAGTGAAGSTAALMDPPAHAPAHGRRSQTKRIYDDRGYYLEPRRMDRDDRIWRDDEGRYRCRRDNGTTGIVVGAALGALAGRTIDTRGDRTVGTLLGGALGAVLGREIDRGELRCR